MAHAIFYTYQTGGACAGVCACDRPHWMEKTGSATWGLYQRETQPAQNDQFFCNLCQFKKM